MSISPKPKPHPLSFKKLTCPLRPASRPQSTCPLFHLINLSLTGGLIIILSLWRSGFPAAVDPARQHLAIELDRQPNLPGGEGAAATMHQLGQ